MFCKQQGIDVGVHERDAVWQPVLSQVVNRGTDTETYPNTCAGPVRSTDTPLTWCGGIVLMVVTSLWNSATVPLATLPPAPFPGTAVVPAAVFPACSDPLRRTATLIATGEPRQWP
jgi:hypothetical protein